MNIIDIYQSNQTIFTTQEISQLFPSDSPFQLNNALHYAVKKGKLLHLRRGIYAKKDYDNRELAAALYIPSYISLETVLRDHGIIFQTSSTIQSVSYLSRSIKVVNTPYEFRKLKDQILTNPQGLISHGRYTIASAERALLDSIAIFSDYHFDNLTPINWDLVDQLIPLYENQSLARKANKLRIQHLSSL